MSAAYRCNRCGTFFDVAPIDGPPLKRRRGDFGEVAEFDADPPDPPVQIKCRPLSIAEGNPNLTAIPFDLCSRCARGFREFLHNGPGG